ncbi:MAG: DUF3467 domain-containing protein [Candidatus Cloacimonetes bacterium]|jgi:hypothetical protein|nr:DUF3467 domain-containing protein [Candidatus Cloacimonadota bacterium]
MNQPKKQKLNIKLDEQVGEGIYSNFCMITNSPSEFILDFGRIVPGLPSAKIYSRIMTTPQHAKQFLKILKQNIENFEEKHGEINLPGQHEVKDIGFKNQPQNS